MNSNDKSNDNQRTALEDYEQLLSPRTLTLQMSIVTFLPGMKFPLLPPRSEVILRLYLAQR
jgi:hypothetical protein